MFFVGTDKGGIVVKSAQAGGFQHRCALHDHGTCHEKSFAGNVIVNRISGFCFEFTHEMILAHIIFSGKVLYRKIPVQMTVNVFEQAGNLRIAGVCPVVGNILFFQKNPVQVDHELIKQRMI